MTSRKAPLSGLTLSVVGPGRVGSSLASWIVSHGARLTAVAAREPESAQRLSAKLGGRVTAVEKLESANDDLLLVAVSDNALESVAKILACRRQAAVALHTSGRKTAESLAALRPGGTAIGSLHPLMAFPEILENPEVAIGAIFGIDGDEQARVLSRHLVGAWSGKCTNIPADARDLYHLGATLAAGGVVTLLACAADLAQTLGLSPTVAEGYLKLAQGAVDSAGRSRSIAEAITGPVARGDLEGFAGQISRLREIDPGLADLAEKIAEKTLSIRSNLERER